MKLFTIYAKYLYCWKKRFVKKGVFVCSFVVFLKDWSSGSAECRWKSKNKKKEKKSRKQVVVKMKPFISSKISWNSSAIDTVRSLLLFSFIFVDVVITAASTTLLRYSDSIKRKKKTTKYKQIFFLIFKISIQKGAVWKKRSIE